VRRLAGLPFARDFPGIAQSVLQDEREERPFAGAVRSDQSDAIAANYLERDILEKDAPGEGFGDL
jgi:hypothetical protein